MTRLSRFLDQHRAALEWSAITSLVIWVVGNLVLLALILTGHPL